MLVEPMQKELGQRLRGGIKYLLQKVRTLIIKGAIEYILSWQYFVDEEVLILDLEYLYRVSCQSIDAKFKAGLVHLHE